MWTCRYADIQLLLTTYQAEKTQQVHINMIARSFDQMFVDYQTKIEFLKNWGTLSDCYLIECKNDSMNKCKDNKLRTSHNYP